MCFDLEFDFVDRSCDLEMTLHEKFSSTCFLHNIPKLEVRYFSLACNIKSKYANTIKIWVIRTLIPRQMSRFSEIPTHFILGSCLIFFSMLPNYPNEQIHNLSFLLQIVFELKLFLWHMVGGPFLCKNCVWYNFSKL